MKTPTRTDGELYLAETLREVQRLMKGNTCCPLTMREVWGYLRGRLDTYKELYHNDAERLLRDLQ